MKGKTALKVDLKHRLKQLEDMLVKTQTSEDTCTLLLEEQALLAQLGDGKSIVKVIKHLNYLRNYWTTNNLWKSWSDFGHNIAASLLGCEMDATTNYLKSFNSVLKHRHLWHWENGGRSTRMFLFKS